MPDQCCTFCAHNPALGAKPGWWVRAWWWIPWRINILFGRLIFIRKEPEAGTSGCQRNPRLFCYDVHDSEGCRRHSRSTRPEFLACRACPHFEMRGKS